MPTTLNPKGVFVLLDRQGIAYKYSLVFRGNTADGITILRNPGTYPDALSALLAGIVCAKNFEIS